MKHQNGILFAIATFFLGRSRKLRWLVPVLPLGLAFYRKMTAQTAMRDPRMRAPARS